MAATDTGNRPPGADRATRTRVARSALIACCLLVAACAPRLPPPPASLAAVVVLPIADASDRSAVTGVFTFYSWIAEARDAVPSQLTTGLRETLDRRGIATRDGRPADSTQAAIAQAERLDAPVLYVVLYKWEAENRTSPQFVSVALEATLLAPGSGKTLWTTGRVAMPVSTLNAIDLTSAYRMATESVAEWLVGNWTGTAR